jgi:excinuclease ABC subunit B
MAEDLTEYYAELGVKVRYLHSDIDTLERIEILRDLRRGLFDVLVGINLLREGLDLPEVSLVGILDADKEGFLRSPRSLIQTIGRAARNVNGQVIMYGDRVTDAMRRAIEETDRRRKIQADYNTLHGITPETTKRAVLDMGDLSSGTSDWMPAPSAVGALEGKAIDAGKLSGEALADHVEELRSEMIALAEALEFERAAKLRDRIVELEQRLDTMPRSANGRPERALAAEASPGKGPSPRPKKARAKR